MGTRSGDVDAGALTLIMEKEEIDYSSLNTLLNKHSGVLGISGISSDMREVESAAEEGEERAILALRMYDYRVKKYIGAYAAAMGGVDLLILLVESVKTHQKPGRIFVKTLNLWVSYLTGMRMLELMARSWLSARKSPR